MKRSRTCQCLVELDTPKRSRSTPDLGVLQRKHDVFGRRQNPPNAPIAASAGLDAALRFFRQAVPKPASTTAAAAAAAVLAPDSYSAGGGFVVDSIVRSKGSLNEITILEHEQFIGEESVDDAAAAVVTAGVGIEGIEDDITTTSIAGQQSSMLFGGTVPGSLFDDSGDSSDYFCGVASSDEADEDGACRISVGLGVVGKNNDDDGLFTTPISINTSDTDSTGHVSDASSSGAAAGDDVVGVNSSAPLTAEPRGCSDDAASPPPGRLAGDAWRQRPYPRVSVRFSTPVSASSGGVTCGAAHRDGKRQRETVSPPWPVLVPASGWGDMPAPHMRSRAESGSSGLYGDGRRGGNVVREQHGHGPLVSSGEDVKVLIGLDRLRLMDHTEPPVVQVGLDPMWQCRNSPLGREGADADTTLETRRRGMA